MLSGTVQNPRDIFFLFDIESGNPNGDPDQNGSVRYDDEVRKAEITGVCLKRKIRDRISLMKGNKAPYDIYFSSSQTVLNNHHRWAMEEVGIEIDDLVNDKEKKGSGANLIFCSCLLKYGVCRIYHRAI